MSGGSLRADTECYDGRIHKPQKRRGCNLGIAEAAEAAERQGVRRLRTATGDCNEPSGCGMAPRELLDD